jgi:type VI secretion system protein ImpC
MNFDISFRPAGRSISADDSQRYCVAILGDFAGSAPATATSGSLLIDCDNFSDVLARFEPVIGPQVGPGEPEEIRLRFRKLEDFHPDQLIAQVEPFRRLAQLRTRLLEPATFAVASQELQNLWSGPPAAQEPPVSGPGESTDEMFARLLGKAPAARQPVASPTSSVDRLIKGIVAPHLLPAVDPQQSQLVALVEAELATRLRDILHNPDFQAIEATWRAVDFLVRSCGEQIELRLINLGKSALEATLSAGDLAQTPIFRQLREIHPTIILGIYSWGTGDSATLKALARLAHACQTAMITAADPDLVGCGSFGSQPDPDDWVSGPLELVAGFEELRRMPEAVHLGLVMPRFLLRQPYGEGSETIETFQFEEMPAEHESYLWGNPALLFGRLFAEAVAADPLAPDWSAGGEISGIPTHRFTSEGETKVKPYAEAWLSDRAANAIFSHGIMPVVSVRGRDSVRLPVLCAVSNPPKPLALGRP